MLAFDDDGNQIDFGTTSKEAPTDRTAYEGHAPEMRALLDTIAGGESRGYDDMYSGDGRPRRLRDYADHPRSGAVITKGPNAGQRSTAAGRYMQTEKTWDGQAKKLGLPDYGPESQDISAADLAETTYGNGLLDALKTDDDRRIAHVGRGLNSQWTSLPGGIESRMSDRDFVNAYRQNLAKYKQAAGSKGQIGFSDEELTPIEPPKATVTAAPETAVKEPSVFDKGMSAVKSVLPEWQSAEAMQLKPPSKDTAPAVDPDYKAMEDALQTTLAPQYVDAVRNAYEAASPEKRQQLMEAPGELGAVAQYVHKKYQDTNPVMSSDPVLQGMGGRREDVVQRNITNGMDRQSAEAMADREVNFDTAPITGQAQSTNFDFERANELRKSGPIQRGVIQGVEDLKKQAAGLHLMAADFADSMGIPGARRYGDAQAKARDKLALREQEMGEAPNEFDRHLESAIRSTVSNAPGLVAGVLTGGEAIPLLGMGAQVTGDEYATGIKQGLSREDATKRAVLYGAAEILGEKIGFKDQVDLLKKATQGNLGEFERLFVKNLAEQVAGEEATTVSQWRIDKSKGFGLDQDSTAKDLLNQMKDTVYQTVLQTTLMGVPGAARAVVGSIKDRDRRYQASNDTLESTLRTKIETLTKDPEFIEIMRNETDSNGSGLDRAKQARQILAERRALRDVQSEPLSSTGISGESNAQNTDVSREGNALPAAGQEIRLENPGPVGTQQNAQVKTEQTGGQGPVTQKAAPVTEDRVSVGPYEMRPFDGGINIIDSSGNIVSAHKSYSDAVEAFDQLNAAPQETTNELQTSPASVGQSVGRQNLTGRGQQTTERAGQGSGQEAQQERRNGLDGLEERLSKLELLAQAQEDLGNPTEAAAIRKKAAKVKAGEFVPEIYIDDELSNGGSGGSATEPADRESAPQAAALGAQSTGSGGRTDGDVRSSADDSGQDGVRPVGGGALTPRQESELRGHNLVLKKLGKPELTPEQYLEQESTKLKPAASNRTASDLDVLNAYNKAVDQHNATLDAGGTSPSGSLRRSRIKVAATLPSTGLLQRRAAESIAKVFGHKVIFVESENGRTLDIDGSIIGSHPNHIILAVDSKQNLSRVAVHELVHGLRRNSPEIYAQLVRNLREYYNPIEVAKHLEARGYDPDLPSPNDNPERFTSENRNEEEWISDHVSDILHNPESLKQLAERMDGQKSGSGQQFLQHVKDFIDSLITKLRGKGFGTEAALTSKTLRKSRDAVVEALAQYAERNQKQSSQSEPEVAASNREKADSGNIQDVAKLDNALKIAKGQVWRKGRDLKQAIQDAVMTAAGKAGINPREFDTDATFEYLKKVARQDVLFALKQNPNAVGWYDEKTHQALALMALVHPEIKKNQNARFAFVWALAVTSNGMKVDKNFELAEKAYEFYKKTGRMPTDIQAGQAQKAINKSLKLFNDLVDQWGMDDLRRFMLTDFKVSEIAGIDASLKPGGEHVDVTVKGAAILGPKIGNGFFSNLYGNFDSLTMDRWLIRTWGRWTGTLISEMPELTEKARERLSVALKSAVANPKVAEAFEKAMGHPIDPNADIDTLAGELQKASMDPAARNTFSKTEVGNELRKAGNGLAKYLDGQKEAPSGPTERKDIRRVFQAVLDELNETEEYKDLTMADMQAVLWYAEKRLYESAKEDFADDADETEGYTDEEAPDYANAAATVARSKGVSEKKIKATLKQESNDGRSTASRSRNAGEGLQQPQTGQQEAARGFAPPEKRTFLRTRAVHRIRSNRAGDGEQSWAYSRKGRGASGKPGLLRNLGVTAEADWKLSQKAKNALGNAGPSNFQAFHELVRGDETNARKFAEAINSIKQSLGKDGAAVYAYPEEDYRKMRLFLAEDGKAGFALKPDGDIVSVFGRGQGDQIMLLATQLGGKKLDAFDTMLGELYGRHGFVAVSRTRWNDEFAPEDWNKQDFAGWNGGEPDVIFMVYDPGYSGKHSSNDGKYYPDYDQAAAAQRRGVLAVRKGKPLTKGRSLFEKDDEQSGNQEADIPASNRSNVAGNERNGAGAETSARPSYGTTRRGAIRAVGVHYSRTQRERLSGDYYGQGAKGEEAERVNNAADTRLRNRVYFYINAGKGVSPEQGVGGHAHSVLLKNLYDIDADPMSLAEGVTGDTYNDRLNNLESSIIDSGYDGYVTDFGTQRAAVLIGDHSIPVRYEGVGRPQVDAGERGQENDAKRILRLLKQDWSRKTPQAWGEYLKSKQPDLYARNASAFTGTGSSFWPDEMAKRISAAKAPEIPASNRHRSTFYSQLERGIQQAKIETQPATQWRAWLQSNKSKYGIKDDEIAWSGLDDYLNLKGKEKLSKADISEFLADNGVNVKEILKSNLETAKPWRHVEDDLDETAAHVTTLIRNDNPDLGQVQSANVSNRVYDYIDSGDMDVFKDFHLSGMTQVEIARLGSRVEERNMILAGSTKYEDYTLPGGENYRELLLTTPTTFERNAPKLEAEIRALGIKKPLGDISISDLESAGAGKDLVGRFEETILGSSRDTYFSAHWDELNVIAHIRFNDRTDAEGNKVLFVEEIQSDWAQEGRKKGFALPEAAYKALDARRAELERMGVEARSEGREFPSELKQEWADIMNKIGGVSGQGNKVSKAPFITDTKAWVSLAIKRIIRYAAEGGYDKVAFVNGDQSAERYDLSKQISRVVYEDNNSRGISDARMDGDPSSGTLKAYDLSGKEIISKHLQDPSEMEEIIGKDLSKKLLEAEPKLARSAGLGVRRKEVSGLDLKVGGEGMVSFYDKIVPQVTRDVLKKLGGGDVRQADLGITNEDELLALNKYKNRLYGIYGSKWEEKLSDDERKKLESLQTDVSKSLQNQFDITPAIREKALSGLPMFSNRKSVMGQAVAPTWDAPEESRLDDLIYTLQDKLVDTKQVQKEIEKAGRAVDDEWNPYQKELLYHGRSAKLTQDFLVNEIKPLFKAMTDEGVSMESLELYLWNRHAEERNNQIATINLSMPDGGSGIETADAQKYLSSLTSEEKGKFERLAKMVDKISEGTRKLLVSSGLETQDTILDWQNTYEHYVPLNRADIESSRGRQGTGQGFSIRGPSTKQAMGSGRPVVDILANLMMQRERTIVRAEKNKVALALYGLAIQNENPGFWLPVNPEAMRAPVKTMTELMNLGLDAIDFDGLMKEPTVRVVNPKTGLVETVINPALRNRDNVLAVRVNGKDRFIFFNEENPRAMRMAASLKNLDADQLGTILTGFRAVTRFVASINTQYNPIFGIVNLVRDVGGGAINLTSTQIAGKEHKVLAQIAPAIAGIYQDLRADRKGKARSSGQWSQLWEEFQEVGGKTGYRDLYMNSEDRAKALQREIDAITQGAPKKFFKGVFNWLSDYNETLENGVRLAAYKVARDQGMSKDQAAALAKNLTVNFNKKGQIAQQAGALYAFFNASVQGTARLAETLAGPAGKKIVTGGLLLGAAQAILLSAAGFDDDEPPQFVRERNIIIPIGNKRFITIPLPLGFHVIPNTGRVLTEIALNKGEGATKQLIGLLGSYIDSFDPMGSSGLSVQTLTPTLIDPFAALSENRDSFGKEIAKKDRSSLAPTPGFTRAKETASTFGKVISEMVNTLSGGTEFVPGEISPTPDQIDYLIGQATGGVGREAMKIDQTVRSLMSGEELPPHKIPLVGRFYGTTTSQSAESGKFYSNLTALNKHEAQMKGMAEQGGDVEAYVRKNPEAALASAANGVEKTLSDLKTRKRLMLSRGAPKSDVKSIETEITSLMRDFNAQVKESREAPNARRP